MRKKRTDKNEIYSKTQLFDEISEYKYCMVHWSIIIELQIQNILRKC